MNKEDTTSREAKNNKPEEDYRKYRTGKRKTGQDTGPSNADSSPVMTADLLRGRMTRSDLRWGIIMSEFLSPPRARRPHRSQYWK